MRSLFDNTETNKLYIYKIVFNHINNSLSKFYKSYEMDLKQSILDTIEKLILFYFQKYININYISEEINFDELIFELKNIKQNVLKILDNIKTKEEVLNKSKIDDKDMEKDEKNLIYTYIYKDYLLFTKNVIKYITYNYLTYRVPFHLHEMYSYDNFNIVYNMFDVPERSDEFIEDFSKKLFNYDLDYYKNFYNNINYIIMFVTNMDIISKLAINKYYLAEVGVPPLFYSAPKYRFNIDNVFSLSDYLERLSVLKYINNIQNDELYIILISKIKDTYNDIDINLDNFNEKIVQLIEDESIQKIILDELKEYRSELTLNEIFHYKIIYKIIYSFDKLL